MTGSLLTKVIEGEIIPRLFLAHRDLRLREQQDKERPDNVINSKAFARLVLASEAEEIVAYIQTLLDGGITLQAVFLDLLSPVARKLGELWEDDQCSFADVTLGLSCLHRVLHQVSRPVSAFVPGVPHHRAFFAPVPGEHHTFGVSMLEEFFLHAGWEASCECDPSTAGILKVAANQDLDVIGFSVGCRELFDPLSDLIDKTRKASRNRNVLIMVGGGLFVDNQDLAKRFGNATILADGVDAVQVAEETVSRVCRMAGVGNIL